jgi:hypothetical protein
MITDTITTIIIESLSAWPVMVGCLLLAGLIALVFVAGRAVRRRGHPAEIRPVLQGTQAELQWLARELDTGLSRQLSQLDRVIVAGEREIARLQRLSASGRLSDDSAIKGRTRQPDLVMDDEPIILRGPFAEPPKRKRAA